MLTVYRGNRAELLAELLATQLRLEPPGPFEQIEVVVNTWPTSRWLGEQLAIGLGGIAANMRFPFPGAHLRRLVAALLDEQADGGDPWRASALVWPVLELLPVLVEQPQAAPLRQWLQQRGEASGQLDLARWQLGRAIADAVDDYALYRPDQLALWWQGQDQQRDWQPLLLSLLRQRIGAEPFGLRVQRAIARLAQGDLPGGVLPQRLRLFGLSAMAPVQVQLLQALSVHLPVDLYLLTPCRDLWQRCTDRRRQLSDALALQQPLGGDWLLAAPGLEARFGRLGAEFQQLLEGTGETQLGVSTEHDLFFAAAAVHRGQGPAPLLAQLQQQLADPDQPLALERGQGDASLEFHPCPGRLRQVQIVRDRVLQLLAADPTLEPRDVLVMTPEVDALAPLLASVFADQDATGVSLPWRLTDRSQQSEADLGRTLLQLLQLAGERLTASALEQLLERPCLAQAFGLDRDQIQALNQQLQQLGFRWGLDGRERGGCASGSLAWACDRLLLGLVLPAQPGLAPRDTAPHPLGQELELLGRWLHLLGRLRHWLGQLRRPRTCAAWAELLAALLRDLFGEGGAAVSDQAWELPLLLAAIDDWQQAAAGCELELTAAVVAAVLDERLSADSGRFGHRSGALTVSALEPMRAIPHRVIVLLGLDAGVFPRQRQRPGFHLLEQQRRLGDPNPADQDRYVLLEALLSARDHLLICWSSRDERTGEPLPPATPVRQWLAWLQSQLPCGGSALVVSHAASALDRTNFEPGCERPPTSCDRRLLRARRLLDNPAAVAPLRPLAEPLLDPVAAVVSPPAGGEPDEHLRDWLVAPQRQWLQGLGLAPREWAELIEDLDALALAEQQRAALLRQALEDLDDPDAAADCDAVDLAEPEGWLQRWRGQAQLPPLGGGVLEAATLAQRWRTVQQQLASLGTPQWCQASWGPWQQRLHWRGQTVVLVHHARDRCRHRLALWLQLLLAAAAGQQPQGAVLLARGAKGFGQQLVLVPPAEAAARAELERLAGLQQQWHGRCWPVPPETGWALVTAGEAKAIATWDGSPQQPGERAEPEQALCFGADLGGSDLLAGAAGRERGELARALLTPLLEQVR
ncbi:MAG: Exodeoxyribonuclease gamma subunit [Cyanobacteriota bacterium]